MKATGRLNLKGLRAFVEVYRWRKLSTAAERLHLTPSAVSILLRQVEESVGATLFDRTTRGLTPTEVARQTLPIAERVLRDVETLEGDFGSSSVPTGKVVVAVTPTVALTLMPSILRSFQEAHPQIRASLIDGETSQFVPRILSGEADLGLGAPGQSIADLDEHTLVQDYLHIVFTHDHPFARKSTIRWSDLAGHELVGLKAGYGIRSLIDKAAREAKVQLSFRHEVSLLITALAMTAEGLGPSIVPGDLVALSGFSRLETRRIARPYVLRNISVVTHRKRTLSEAASLFLAHAQASLRRG